MNTNPRYFQPGSDTITDERGKRYVVQFETPFGAFALRKVDDNTEELLVKAASAESADHMYNWFIRWEGHHYRGSFCDLERGLFRCVLRSVTTWDYACASGDCRRAIVALTSGGDKLTVKEKCRPYIKECLDRDALLKNVRSGGVRGVNWCWSLSALCEASCLPEMPGAENMPWLMPT